MNIINKAPYNPLITEPLNSFGTTDPLQPSNIRVHLVLLDASHKFHHENYGFETVPLQ